MAGIFANIDSDISKIRQLKSEIEKVKKALTSINVKVDIDIAKGMEAQLKSLTAQYDALVQKVAQAEVKIAESTSRINKSAETVIKAQEQMTKAASGQGVANAQGTSGGNTAATNAQTASVEAQAKAYDELADEIDAVMGTRSQNIKRMLEEQNAIRIINEEIKNLTKYQSGSSTLSASQQKRLEQLNASLLTHKTALSELRQSLNNSFKLDAAAATSMNALSQSLARMRMTYRELTEDERNSPFGQELLASIQQADAKIKQLDASIGNHQRNVGNYASGWNGLNMSIQQIGRELPSLAMGWNTFFLAISNNLPILTDEIKRAKDEYNRLKEAGQQATPVWKQVVSSLLSWQTALTVGITLLTLYGKDIIEWVGNLFKAKDGTKELEEAMKRLNTAISSVYGNASEEMRVLKDLNKSLENAKRGTEEWNQIRNKLVTGYSKYLPSIDQEIDKTGTLANSYDRLAESIQKAAAARGFEELKSNEDKKYADSLIKTYQDVSKRLVSLYGEEQGRAYFEGWKRWLERLNNGEELSAKVQGAYGNVSMSSWNPFNDDTLNSLMQDLNKQYKAREKALDEYRKIFGITEGAEDNIASDSIKALRDRIAANREALEKLSVSSKEYKDLLASIQKDEQRLSLLTSSKNTAQSEINSAKSYLDELTKLREDNEDREIDLMKEGTEKQLAEINLRYDRQIAAVKKLRDELKQEQGGKLSAEQTSTFDAALTGIEAGRKRDTGNVWRAKLRSQEQSWNEYLQKYGNYEQKRFAITQEYEQKIAEETDIWKKAALRNEMNEVLTSLDIEAAKTTSAISALFGDMTDKTLKELERLNEQGSAALEFLKSGQWDEEKGMSFGITKEQFDTLSKSPDMLQAISEALRENKETADELRPAYDKVADGLNKIFNAGDDSKKLNQALKDIQEGSNEIMQSAGFLADTFSSLGDAFGSDALSGIAEGINVAMNTANSAIQGAQAGAIFGPIGSAAGAAVGLVSSLAGAIAKIHDKKNEKRIQRLQDQIDTLDKSYDKLGRSVEEAYSKDASNLIEQQNKLLEQQKLLIEQQIKEEQAKKKSDDSRIKEWQQQLEEINQTIEDNKEKAVDAIFGEDLQSAIENFASAYAEAWASGEDRAQSAKDTVKKMMQQMVTESIKAAIQSSGAMEDIRQKLQQFYADNVLSGWEQEYIYNMAEELQKELDEQFGWADSLMGGDKKQQSATSRGFETMTQDQASELNGRFTALNESSLRQESIQQGISNIADDARNIIAQSYLELQQISENTGEIIKPIKQMQLDIAEVKRNTSRL